MKEKTMLGIGILALSMLAAITVSVASAQNEVYLMPQHSNASFCNTVGVQIWANTTDTFGVGQINLTYDYCCANVTDLEYGPLWQGTWDSRVDSKEWLVFMRPLGQPTVSGTVLIGNLTIHCCNESECVTPLTFSLPSKLNDPIAGDLTVIWRDGTFNCLTTTSTTTPTASHPINGGGAGGARIISTPTLTPTQSPTPTPASSPMPTASPTVSLTPTFIPSPTPKPAETQGFEAFFAMLILLAISFKAKRMSLEEVGCYKRNKKRKNG